MPIYEYQCSSCGKILSRFRHGFDNIDNEIKCDCLSIAHRKYSPCYIHSFKPYYNVMAGEWFKNKHDAKEKCKKKYLELSD